MPPRLFPLDEALETRAAYWESRIKTYGFQRVADLSLCEITVHKTKIDQLARVFCRSGEAGVDFHLVFCRFSPRGLHVILLLSAQGAKLVEENMRELLQPETDQGMGRTSAAEMVLFQGPHFGDRSGILDTAMRALAAKGIRVKAAVCSGSCISLVFPEGKSEEAVATLSEVFEVPKASSRRRSTLSA